MMDSPSDYRGAVAAAHAFAFASLKNWMGHPGAQLSEFPEVSYCAASDGVPFNCKASVFHPDTLESILEGVNVPVFDVDINTDPLHINGPLCRFYPMALHQGSSDNQLDLVKGKTSLLVPSVEAKFGI